jgi:acyl transferase domain-containing protein/acyl carrier protein
LYEGEAVFRAEVDRCSELLRAPLGLDLRDVLYPRGKDPEAAAEQLKQTRLTQPALFVVEYALARLWMSWGLAPGAMIGHSVGEYVAAHLAGVFSLEDALALVAERGRLMQEVAPGAMLAVPLGETALRPYLGPGLDLAAVNTPASCVVSGPAEAVERLEQDLAARGITARPLHTSHAFHSAMMDPILPAFVERVRQTQRRAPSVRFVSNVTGTWITDAEATSPDYWARHLRGTVRFSDGLRTLVALDSEPVLLEVGPGNTLASLARQNVAGEGASAAVPSLRHPRETQPDRAFLLRALGKLWLAGVSIDWARMHAGEHRRRVEVPSYPFERQRYWVEPNRERELVDSLVQGFSPKRRPLEDWFYQPSWRRFMDPDLLFPPSFPRDGAWLIFLDETGLGPVLAEQLSAAGQKVTTVTAGAAFKAAGPDRFEIDPRGRGDYAALLKALRESGRKPGFIVHLWGLTAADAGPRPLDEAQALGFYSLLSLAQALSREDTKQPVQLAVVTNHMQEVIGGELTCPEKATVLGPCRVIPEELTNVACHSFDVELSAPGSPAAALLCSRIAAELVTGRPDPMVAYRGSHRWVQSAEPTPLPPAASGGLLKDRGVYLITGGLGGIGLVFSRHLAETRNARLVLTGRSPVPPREEWDGWLASHGDKDATSQRILQIRSLESLGGEVLYLVADVARLEDMKAVVSEARTRFGAIQGLIHSAGVAGGGIIQLKDPEVAARVMAPKVQGTLVLDEVLREEPLDFRVLCSSTAAVLGGFGQVDYCAANAFLDAYAHSARAAAGPPTFSVNWDTWRDVGMAVNTPVSGAMQIRRDFNLKVGISPAEGVDALARILAAGLPQLAVFTMDMRPLLWQAQTRRAPVKPDAVATIAAAEEQPAAAGEGLASDLERTVAASWERILGRKSIGVNDNFFELGGDSLTALQVIGLLKTLLQRDIPIVMFYEAPTVGLLARALGEKPEEKPVALEEVEQRAETRLELMQRRRRVREVEPALDPTR